MAQILVRNLEASVKLELQRRATKHGRSLEAEVRDILREVANAPVPVAGLGSEIARLARECGERFPEISELRGGKPQVPDLGDAPADPQARI